MLKIKLKRIFIIYMFIMSICNITIATQDEILENQFEALNIRQFVSEANKYTGEVFSGIDVKNLMNDAIKGNVNNKTLIGKIVNILGKEIGQTIKIVRKYSCNYCNT